MKKIVVLGAGMVGRTIAIDLKNSNLDVTSVDFNSENLELLSYHGIKTINSNLLSYDFINLSEFDLVVSAVPGWMGLRTLTKVIEQKKNCVDISFFQQIESHMQDIDKLAKENNVLAIIDCGVAPGMSNLILARENEENSIKQFKFYVGGLPLERTLPFEYKAPFSPIDVIEEYMRPARLRKDNQDLVVEPLTEIEKIEVPSIGTLEGFNTDGLRSLLKSFVNIPNMIEKTLRYPGHAEKILFLKSAGFFEPDFINTTSSVLTSSWKLKPEDKDFTYMKCEIDTHDSKKITYEMLDFASENLSSMSKTTGYTATAMVNLLLNNNFKVCDAQLNGVYSPEAIGVDKDSFNFIIQYLKQRNVIWKKTSS